MWTIILDELSEYSFREWKYLPNRVVNIEDAERHVNNVLNYLWKSLKIATYDKLEPTKEFPLRYLCTKQDRYFTIEWSQNKTMVSSNGDDAAAMLYEVASILKDGSNIPACAYAALCLYRLLHIYDFDDTALSSVRLILKGHNDPPERVKQIKDWYWESLHVRSRIYDNVNIPVPYWIDIVSYLTKFVKET